MAMKKNTRSTRKKPKPFRFEFGWSGLAGVTVTVLCVLVWMFMLGVWAGQTILLPPKESKFTASLATNKTNLKVIQPEGKKVPAEKK
jgi:hypothetical protein